MSDKNMNVRAVVCGLILAAAIEAGSPTTARAVEAAETHQFDIKAQELASALLEFSKQADKQVVGATAVLSEARTEGVSGRLSVGAALAELLRGTGLEFELVGEKSVRIVAARSRAAAGGEEAWKGMRLAQADAGQPQTSSSREDSNPATDGERKDGLEEVVVQGAKRKFAPTDSNVATKIPLDIIDTPQALSVVSSELMSMVGVKSLSTVAALTPGVVDQELEIPIYDAITIRGIGNASYKINGFSFSSVGGPIDMGIAERFEIARGPASVIYGQTSYGGTVNVALKMPQAKPAFISQLGYSIDGAYRALADMTGALTASGRLRGRLITIYDNLETAQDLAYQRTTTVAPGLSWDVAENTTLDINLFHSGVARRRANGFQLLQREDGSLAIPAVSKSAFLGAAYSRINATEDFGLATLTHRFSGDWVLTGTVGVSKEHRPLNMSFNGDFTSADGEMPLFALAVPQDALDKSGDLTLRGNFDAFGRTHTLMLNGFFRRNHTSYIGACCESLGTISVYHPDPYAFSNPYADFPDTLNDHLAPPDDLLFTGRSVSTETAASGLLLLHPLDRLSVMAGLRYTRYKSISTDFFDHSISYQVPDNFRDSATDGRFGLVYEVLPDFNVYASYATGVVFNPGIKFSGDALDPEAGVQWEIGAKAALLNRKLMLSAAAFRLDRENVATGDPDHPNTPYSVTIDGQRHRGFELEAVGEPIPGWNLMASYSYLDININMCLKDANGLCTDPFGWNGHQQASSPHDMVKLYTNYQLQGGPLRGVTFGGGVFYVGKREVDNSGTFQVPAYTRVDLRLGYDALENVSFSLNAINVTDEDIYIVQQANNSRTLDYGNRRTVLFRVDFKY